LLNQGIFPASRGEFVVSTPMSTEELDHGGEKIKAAFELLMPSVKEKTHHLLK